MHNNRPLISIIIPVYNGEKYLRSCLDSILQQTFQNWEMIIINDGSTDNSPAICDEYSKDSRITVIHRKNGGQAIARNEGLSIAKGEFVSFVDCDDWFEQNMYESMLSTIQSHKAEILICGYIEEYQTRKKEIRNDGLLKCYEADEAMKMVLKGSLGSYLWSMLFRREVIKELMPDLTPYEDHATVFKWVAHANKVVVWNRAFYHYRQLSNSSLHAFNLEKQRHFLLAVKERYNYIKDNQLLPGWENENRKLYLSNCIKLAKDLARAPSYDSHTRDLIEVVRDELRGLMPIKKHELSLKNYVRLHILFANINIFARILRFSSIFSFVKLKKKLA